MFEKIGELYMSDKLERLSFQERLDHFVSVIRTEIINGIRQEGTYLPAESALAKQFELSNKSIRKGLEGLVEEGLIVKIDRVGSMVTPRAKEAITINFGCPISLTTDFVMDDLIAEFSKRNPGIHVRRISLSHSGYVQSAKEMMTNGLLDVVAFNSPQFQEWTEEGLTPLLEPQSADERLYKIAEEAFLHEESLYARPVSFSPVVLCYNKSHFAKAGIDAPDSYWTWQDLMDAAAKLSNSRGKPGIYFLPTSENRYSIFLLQGAGQHKRDVIAVEEQQAGLLEGLSVLNALIGNRSIFPNYWAHGNDETIQLFVEGQVSIILCTYFNLNEFAHSTMDYDICPLPTLRRGDPQRTLLLSIGMSVVKSSKVKEAARTFVDFLSSEAAQNMIRDKTMSIPARKESSNRIHGGAIKLPSRYAMFRELLPSFAYHSDLGIQMKDLRKVTKWLKEYWSNMIDEEELNGNLLELTSSQKR